MPLPPGRSPYPTRSARTSLSNTGTGSSSGTAGTSGNGGNSPRRRSSSNSFQIQPNNAAGWSAVREPASYHQSDLQPPNSSHNNQKRQHSNSRSNTSHLYAAYHRDPRNFSMDIHGQQTSDSHVSYMNNGMVDANMSLNTITTSQKNESFSSSPNDKTTLTSPEIEYNEGVNRRTDPFQRARTIADEEINMFRSGDGHIEEESHDSKTPPMAPSSKLNFTQYKQIHTSIARSFSPSDQIDDDSYVSAPGDDFKEKSYTNIQKLHKNDNIHFSNFKAQQSSYQSQNIESSRNDEIDTYEAENDHIRLLTKNALNTFTSPATAMFFASILYTRTNHSPCDALLYAKALFANNEYKRTILVLEQSGLLPHNQRQHSSLQPNLSFDHNKQHNFTRRENEINTTAKMVVEASLIASKCLCIIGEYEEAASLLEETCRYPPTNATAFLDHNGHYQQHCTPLSSQIIDDGNDPQLSLLAKHIIPDRSHLEKGEIHPLARLACMRGKIYIELSNPTRATDWLKAALNLDSFCVEALEYLFDRQLLTVKEEQKLVEGLVWKKNGYDTNMKRKDSYTNDKGKETKNSELLNDDKDQYPNDYWLKDYFMARVNVQMNNPFPISLEEKEKEGDEDMKMQSIGTKKDNQNTTGMNHKKSSSLHQPEDLRNEKSLLSSVKPPPPYQIHFQSPLIETDASAIHPTSPHLFQPNTSRNVLFSSKSPTEKRKSGLSAALNSRSTTRRDPFQRLQTKHNLAKSPVILALSAKQSYVSHHIRRALQLCRACQSLDPLNPGIVFIHAAALFALRKKRELFHLAHVFVNANPRAAIGWFAVGCYYMICHKYETAQRHFCRATRLDPKCADAWIGFGCAFAAADESDQALASFRAAQRLHQGSHIPILYMGMEYLRTNHLSLAGHFLGSAGRMNGVDPLSFNELGVCAYRLGDFKEAARLFVHSLRLSVRLDILGARNKDYSNIDQEQTVEKGMERLRMMTGLKDSMKEKHETYNYEGEYHNTEENLLDVENLSDSECISACRDAFWEPTIFNLGHSFRKIKRFDESLLCFEKAISLCPVSIIYRSIPLKTYFQI